MVDLSRVGERGRLSPRPGDEPHWHRLRPRCSLGYRPSRKGGLGTWFARVLDEQRDKYVRKGLGAFPDTPSHQIFSVAKREAEAWADEVEAGGLTQKHIVTVRDACEDSRIRAVALRSPIPRDLDRPCAKLRRAARQWEPCACCCASARAYTQWPHRGRCASLLRQGLR